MTSHNIFSQIDNLTLDKKVLIDTLKELANGFISLKNTGRFDEPNLDGTPSDYISSDAWEWPQGVGLYGIFRFYEISKDESILRYLQQWYHDRIAEGLPIHQRNVNTTAPMLTMALVYEETKDPVLLPPMQDWANWILHEAPRTPEGGFQHLVSDGINPDELWDDTLIMQVLFLAKYGSITNNQAMVDEAIYQFLLHTKYLTDTHTGLWFHGFTFEGRHNFARALWGRGNAWITMGILDFIDMVKLPQSIHKFLLGCFKCQVATLQKLQAQSGLWNTLLDDPSSYEESSCSAGFAYGFLKGYRLGLLDKTYQESATKTIKKIISLIDENGQLDLVSYGTRMGHDLQFYKDIPIQPMGYGQALAILLLAEALNHAN